ncbi:MAG: UV DNA damage repair endonuclease UvsE [Bacilli bacterium]|nr:UV DNA damage repair endonuclease UvsE [Bacilli bacterium]
MKIRLGYACISNIIETTSSKTTTLTYYKKLDTKTKEEKLNIIINTNLDNLKNIIEYNITNNLHFFRITAKLIPLIDLVDIDLNKYKEKFIIIGKLINKNNMRVDVHVDEYCVLNSINETVVLNSIKILNNLKIVMDMFNIEYKIIMHIGSKTNGIKESIKRFKNNYNLLDNELKNKIILENDDKVYNVYQTLKLCEDLKIPMCLDYHHHLCNKCSKDIKYYIPRIYNTYKDILPKMHYSSPKSKKEKRTHNEYINSIEFINFIEILKTYNKDTDIMLEAKGKDLALIKLVYELKFRKNYKYIDESSFII